MRIVTVVLSALLIASGALAVFPAVVAATPAGQAAAASFNIDDGLLSDGCAEVDYDYSLDPITGYTDHGLATFTDIDVDITITDRFGDVVGGDYVIDGGSYDYGTLTVCPDKAGTLYVDTEAYACDYDYDCKTVTGPSATFRLEKPRTRVELTASPINTKKGQVVTFRVLRREEYDRNRYRPDTGYVSLQVLRGSKWEVVRASRTFAYRGHASLRYRVPGTRLKIRAASIEAGFEPSHSRPVTLR